MDQDDLEDLVQFLSEHTQTDITAVGNSKVENELGTQFLVSLFVHSEDVGNSRLYRSKIGPTAALKTDKYEVLDNISHCQTYISSNYKDIQSIDKNDMLVFTCLFKMLFMV